MLPDGDIDAVISNADSAESYGLEIDAEFEATSRLRLTSSLGLLETKAGRVGNAITQITGNDLPFAPSVTVTLGVNFAVTDRFSVVGQLTHSAGYYSDIQNTPGNKVDDLTVPGLRASYAATDNAEIYGYVKNVFDTVQATEIFSDGTTGVTNRLREIGFGIRASF